MRRKHSGEKAETWVEYLWKSGKKTTTTLGPELTVLAVMARQLAPGVLSLSSKPWDYKV